MADNDRDKRIFGSWIANADAWTKTIREHRIESRRVGTNDAILAAILKHTSGRVLDVGCGEGWLTHTLSGRGYDSVGIDGSPRLIEEAAKAGRGSFRVLSYEEIVASPASLDGPYDGVVLNFALLSEQIVPLLIALRSSLGPGGLVFIQTVHPFTACGDEPYKDAWRTETFSSLGEGFSEPMPWFFRTVASWHASLTASGLRIRECMEPLHPDSGRPLSLLFVCSSDAP